MQNIAMGYDSRSVANYILDIADRKQVSVSNMKLNKLIFFAHSDLITSQNQSLVHSTFEAWKHGPVLPIIYHQFKTCGKSNITTRATKLCRNTGQNVIAKYDTLKHLEDHLVDCIEHYGRMTANQLRTLSHVSGGAWDYIWNSIELHNLGMRMPDTLIRDIQTNEILQKGASNYAH